MINCNYTQRARLGCSERTLAKRLYIYRYNAMEKFTYEKLDHCTHRENEKQLQVQVGTNEKNGQPKLFQSCSKQPTAFYVSSTCSKFFLQYLQYPALSDRNISKRIGVFWLYTLWFFLNSFIFILYSGIISYWAFSHSYIYIYICVISHTIILYTRKWKWDLRLTFLFR